MSLIILGLFLFVLLVIVHEFGHFIVAKKNGVDVEEFGLGFPPKLFGKTMGKGIFKGYYSFNLLPLGGFVKMKGEHDADSQKGSFGSAKTSAKLKIMVAGVLMNLAVAIFMFMIVAWVGMPQLVENQFNIKNDSKLIKSDVIASYVDEGSPAQKAGLESGDIVISVGEQEIENSQELMDATSSNAGKTVDIVYEKEGQTKTTTATLLTKQEVEASENTDEPKGYLGIVSSEYKLIRSTWSAPIVAVGVTTQFTSLTLKGIGSSLLSLGRAAVNAITGQGSEAKQDAAKASENVAGPVGLYAVLTQGTVLGYQFTLFVIAVISLSLAILNILPIPALDGGRVCVTLIFRALKKPLTPKTEDLIHGTGFSLLMLLFIAITIVDVRRFF
jgi:regulator of sigma E protease